MLNISEQEKSYCQLENNAAIFQSCFQRPPYFQKGVSTLLFELFQSREKSKVIFSRIESCLL
jgi:hypothetical protein